jgi:hypothetical protein
MTIPILPRRILVSIPRNIIDDAIQRGDIAICFRVGGTDCCYTGSSAKYSNTVCHPLPSLPEPESDGPPCITPNDISGFTIKVSYDPENCTRGHICNDALFNCYVNNTNIGQINLNNATVVGGPLGGPRSSTIVLPANTVAIDDRYDIRLEGDASLKRVHRGICRIQIFDLDNRIIFDQCARDDIDNFIFVCV